MSVMPFGERWSSSLLISHMDEPLDQLKQFRAIERENLSHSYVDLKSLDEARAHQRGEPVGKRRRTPVPRGTHSNPRSRGVPPEIRAEIRAAKGTQKDIAEAYGLSPLTVHRIRNEYK